jgi:hypothetical protein
MLYNKWLVYYDTSKQHINTVCEQIAEPLYVEACDTYGYHHEPKQCVQHFFLFVMKVYLKQLFVFRRAPTCGNKEVGSARILPQY